MNPKISRKVISRERAMVAQVFLAKDSVVPTHHHESEQLTYILEGALKFELEGREIVVRKGEVPARRGVGVAITTINSR